MWKINEVFRSIQGEGFHTGKPAVFVRFGGCSCGCPGCDTDGSTRVQMATESLWREVCNLCTPYTIIVLTGGEPTEQLLLEENRQETVNLLKGFREVSEGVHLETNGLQMHRELRELVDWITVSPKLRHPGDSRQGNPLNHFRELFLSGIHIDEVKFVPGIFGDVPEQVFMDFVTSVWNGTKRPEDTLFYVQPLDGKHQSKNYRRAQELIKTLRGHNYLKKVGFSVQWHKKMGVK